ncbi:class I SAM-dependent methyltransferase [Micromonospora sp. AKA38]|uniref:class I SAM-dependent methyltransferase n=1 Tax=Micromonospora sp. AKA38 TaxID=2733861 RepID=UPI0022C2D1F4|nr:class I SAM-dependent methyltransferase [Micromonospora sp. AKA38]GHJ15488.1 hypothetical protein TPA0908_34830 [Micromonospora sp. AKA38]
MSVLVDPTRPAAVELNGQNLRRAAFLAQDGLVLSCTLAALSQVGLLAPGGTLPYPDLPEQGIGALRVALRTLSAQGWVRDHSGSAISWTDAGRRIAPHLRHYLLLAEFLVCFTDTDARAWQRPWSERATDLFDQLLRHALHGWGLERLPVEERAIVRGHLDGALVMPLMLAGPTVVRPSGAGELLEATGWTTAEAQRMAETFGMSASYLPMFARLSEMLRGTLNVRPEADGAEWHVNRAVNVNASGAAHGRYFQDAQDVVLGIFDQEDLARQPQFVADVGCGNGRWLAELYEAIRTRTIRGRHLDAYPLVMVGVDPSGPALQEARTLLRRRNVPAVLLPGDVAEPEQLAGRLREQGLVMEEGLHIRSFIDHDRTYRGARRAPAPGEASAYLDPDGHALAESAVIEDLTAHLARWRPFVTRHGLIVVEAHSISPDVARAHSGDMHGIAFEAYHGLSHQYPLHHGAWQQACRDAGLEAVTHEGRRYPATKPFVAVSLSRLLPAAERRLPWPVPTEDGTALHHLLYRDGDLRQPRFWCAEPTGRLVRAAVAAIERRLATPHGPRCLTLVDYGAGTGLATIELLKALSDRGVEQRLATTGRRLKIHLVDLDSEWFDQAKHLIGYHPWVQFHHLNGADGGFLPLDEVVPPADVIMANMVFHLIPEKAMDKMLSSFRGALRPDGVVVWNSPDIASGDAASFLFHDVNRAVRSTVLHGPVDDTIPLAARQIIQKVRATTSPELARRADRRILPHAHEAAALHGRFLRHFDGVYEHANYEILPDELLDTLLVPSNAAEYFPEISSRGDRELLIRNIIPRVMNTFRKLPGKTATGLSIRWTFGEYTMWPAGRKSATG